jgi:hypothetical protein
MRTDSVVMPSLSSTDVLGDLTRERAWSLGLLVFGAAVVVLAACDSGGDPADKRLRDPR